jgi:flagellar hook-associated protein 2
MAGIGAVDGLVSGLSTSELIGQLIQAESAPQLAMKNRVTVTQRAISSLQSVNTKMAAVLSAAKALTDPLLKTWEAMGVRSSAPDTVIPSVTGTATTGTLNFTVDRLASSHALVSVNHATALSDNVVTGPVEIVFADRTVSVTTADNKLETVVNAINGTANAGVKAAAVQVATGQYKLQLTATDTGAATSFTVNGIAGMGGFNIASQAQEAQITVGSGAGAYTVQRPINTFTNVMPGVTFTALKTGSNITLTSDRDNDAITAKVGKLVDSLNAAMTEIAGQTYVNPATKTKSPLAGDYTARQLSYSLLQAGSSAVGALGDLKKVGIQLTKDGKFTFDQQKFTDNLRADPANTKLFFTDATNGFATRVQDVADRATRSVDGALTVAIQGRTSTVTDLNKRIGDWDLRLATRKAALQRQFGHFETSLGRLKQQSSWLAGQIASLPTSSG